MAAETFQGSKAGFLFKKGPLGTQFACFTSFTGTKVQILTQKPLLGVGYYADANALLEANLR